MTLLIVVAVASAWVGLALLVGVIIGRAISLADEEQERALRQRQQTRVSRYVA